MALMKNCNGLGDDTIEGAIEDISGIIESIPTASLKNANNRKTLKNKFNTIIDQVNDALTSLDPGIASALLADATDKLQNDLITKVDGCAISGSPDKNDWVTSCDEQTSLYNGINDLIDWIASL